MRSRSLHILLAVSAATLLSLNVRADTVQTATAPDYFSTGSFTASTLTSISLAQDTSNISDITASYYITDQGWGNHVGQYVILQLNDNGNTLFSDTISDAYPPQNVNFDLASNITELGDLNAALDGVNWSLDPNVTVDFLAQPVGYGGYTLTIDNFTDTVTSSVPDGASTLALLGFGFAGLGFVRRKLRA